MYHCDACGWSGEEPVLSDEPMGQDLRWTLRACPACGEEVYQMATHARVDVADEPKTSEEIDAVLRAAGHDPEAVAARMRAAAARALARSPFHKRT